MSEPQSPQEPTSEIATARGETVRQFSVFLENRAGALLGVVRLINESLAEVLGVSVQDSVDGTVVRLVVSDPDTVETLFMEKGIAYSNVDVVVVELREAADFGACLAELLVAETNTHFCYPLLCRPNDRPVLAFCLEDNDFGISVLNQGGFKLLCQGDLSR
ncbi:ACT domain-containing protein [soil metagenome]